MEALLECLLSKAESGLLWLLLFPARGRRPRGPTKGCVLGLRLEVLVVSCGEGWQVTVPSVNLPKAGRCGLLGLLCHTAGPPETPEGLLWEPCWEERTRYLL